VAGFVPNAAVTPVGNPLALNVTLPVKPPDGVTVIVLVPAAPPCVMETVAGLADSAKLGVLLITVSVIGVVRTSVPLVPVTVTVAVPTVALVEARNEMTLPLIVAVTPVGSVPTLKVTVPVNPPDGVTVIVVDAAAPPCVIETFVGFADSEKFGVFAITVRAIGVV
jgi:hypothetical protein